MASLLHQHSTTAGGARQEQHKLFICSRRQLPLPSHTARSQRSNSACSRGEGLHRKRRPGVLRAALAQTAEAHPPGAEPPVLPVPLTLSLSCSAEGETFRRVLIPTALALLLCNADRMCMSVAILPLAKEMGWGPSTQGLVQAAFLWGYMLTPLLAGIAADKYGGKVVMATSIAFFSLSSALLPLLLSSPVLALCWFPTAALAVAARVCVGLGEGLALPSMNRLVAANVDKKGRGKALGVAFTGFHCGNLLGLLVSPFLIERFGWRTLFLTFAALGLPLLALWQRVVPDQRRSKPAVAGAGKGQAAVSARELLSKTATWAIVVVNIVNHTGFFIYQAWLPTYFHSVGWSLRNSALLSFVPWTLMSIGSLASGAVADSLVASGTPVLRVRKLMQTIAFMGPAAALVILCQPGLPPAVGVACLTAALGITSLGQAGFVANMSDIAPRHAGVLFGLCNTFASFAGMLSVAGSGVVVARTGSYKPVFLATACLYVVGTAVWNKLCTAEVVFP